MNFVETKVLTVQSFLDKIGRLDPLTVCFGMGWGTAPITTFSLWKLQSVHVSCLRRREMMRSAARWSRVAYYVQV